MNSQNPTVTASRSSRHRMTAGLSALGLAGLLVLGSPAGAAPADTTAGPPGNNGTVKIDGVEFDTHPDNQPHVGCGFEVDFYGFDQGEQEGDLTAKVTFTAQPPTGEGQVLLEEDGIDIGEDDNGGGGSVEGLDAEKEFNLTQAIADGVKAGTLTEHPQQGFHVKLTVNAEGSQGADTKHKVFWVEGCEPTDDANPTANPSGNSGTNLSANPATGTNAGVNVLGESLTQPDTSTPGASVPGTDALGISQAAPSTLARTGSPIGISLLLAAAALTLGLAARRFGRPKTVPTSS